MNLRPFIPLVVPLVILALAGGAYALAYRVLANDRARAETLATDIAAKTAELERASKARAALSTLAADEEALRAYSINKDDIVPFLETIQNTGRPLGAKVEVLSVANEKVGTRTRMALSLSISGSFDAVMRTLGAIEYAPYDGVITSLTLDTTGSTGKGPASWTAATIYSVGLASTTASKP